MGTSILSSTSTMTATTSSYTWTHLCSYWNLFFFLRSHLTHAIKAQEAHKRPIEKQVEQQRILNDSG